MRELKKRRDMLGPEPATNRKTFVEWNLTAELYAFGQRLGEQFDTALLQQAFTHRSYILQEELRQQQLDIEQPETNLRDNRELIERGQVLLAEHTELFVQAHFPLLPEAGVRAVRDHLLSEAVLANVSAHLGTSDLILSAVSRVPPALRTRSILNGASSRPFRSSPSNRQRWSPRCRRSSAHSKRRAARSASSSSCAISCARS